MAIELTDPTSKDRHHTAASSTGQAVLAALRAPSLFNSQPWRWRLHDDSAELWADRRRQLSVVDPQGRLLILSCGIALHHARLALQADGHQPQIVRFPDPDHPDLLALLRDVGSRPATPGDIRAYQAMMARRTDRRPYSGPDDIAADQLAGLRDAAEAEGAHLHVLPDEQVALLNVAAAHAADDERDDPAYREELERWTHRPADAGDGVPVETTVGPVPRRVPIRDFAPGAAGLRPGPGTDRNARYALLFTDTDTAADWLVAGEAMSSVLITASGWGIATNPVSDVVETIVARQQLATMLAGLGCPQMVIRMGLTEPLSRAPATPRRRPDDVIGGTDPSRS